VNKYWLNEECFIITKEDVIPPVWGNISRRHEAVAQTAPTSVDVGKHFKSLGFVQGNGGGYYRGFVYINDADWTIAHSSLESFPPHQRCLGKPVKMVGDVNDWINYFDRI
jgi:hypothetical protein